MEIGGVTLIIDYVVIAVASSGFLTNHFVTVSCNSLPGFIVSIKFAHPATLFIFAVKYGNMLELKFGTA